MIFYISNFSYQIFFIRQNKMSESFVWNYFVKNLARQSATCKECKAEIQCKGFSTSGLIRHLFNKHNISKSKRTAEESEGNSSKHLISEKKITSFFIKKDSLQAIISKMVTLDGISVNSITNSEFIRSALTDRGFNLPKNPSHVMDLIHSEYNEIKKNVISEITHEIKTGKRFSITLDEYTALNNRRYLNINVHATEGKFWNLGMVRIYGNFPADFAVQVVKEKLLEFQISLEKHIVACVTDGAPFMVKFGKEIDCEHQLCYAHGIHLAVCDVLYKKTNTSCAFYFSDSEVGENKPGEDSDADEDSDRAVDIESVFNETCDDDSIDMLCPLNDFIGENVNVSKIISKIRKIAKMFRKSPLKNNTLQGYVQQELGKNLQLMLDSKTRWNSLLTMLERFIHVKSSVSKALIDYNEDENLDLDREEVTVIRDIIAALEPIKVGAEKLGSRNSNLLSAECVFSFILGELNEINSPFSKILKESFTRRIKERRNENLAGILQYLNSPQNYKKIVSDRTPFPLPVKSVIISFAQKMFDRLFEFNDVSCSSEEEQENAVEMNSEILPQTKNLSAKLDAIIEKSAAGNSKIDIKTNNSIHLKKEFALFEATGQKGKKIECLLNALKTIPPTSIESERAFSAAGIFITKLRTRLSDKCIDHFCFLKSYYKNLK